MKKAIVIKNKAHSILEDQERVLRSAGYDYEEFNIPEAGLTLSQMREAVNQFPAYRKVIFLSPVPAMMALMAQRGRAFKAFHNDVREKKELPNGRIIMTVAKTGWEIV